MTFELAPTSSANCPACGFPLAPGASGCSRCGALVGAVSISAGDSAPTTSDPRLSRGDRLLATGLDAVVWALTAGLGWLIWSLIVAKRRQTPAKIVRHHWVINPASGSGASLIRYITRTIISFLELSYVVAGIIWGYGVIIDIGGYWFNSFILPAIILSLIAADFLWILLPGQTRLLDRLLGTHVVHQADWQMPSDSTEATR